jgi:hypothetical protein
MARAHSDLSVRVIPKAGARKGKPKTLRNGSTVKLALGRKMTYLHGLAEAPIDKVRGKAEPSLEIQHSDAEEAWEVDGWVGENECTIVCVFRRPGKSTVTFEIEDASLEDGGGFESDADNGAKDTTKWKMLQVKRNGVELIGRRPARS